MTDSIPFVDLEPMHDEVRDDVNEAWAEITRTNQYIGGPAVERFEAEWATYCGREYAVGVANGTDAIEVALRAAGIGAGDEVIVPANTFIATVEAVIAAGAEPVLVDVDPSTLLLTADHVRHEITDRTAAVIVVHLFGRVVPMDELLTLGAQRDLLIVEDAAQAHGARWRDRPAGSFGQVATFSFYPGKNLGAFGDGGAIVTDNVGIATLAREIANHGSAAGRRYEHGILGRNSRLDAIQAAVLSAKLTRLDGWNSMRRAAADAYSKRLRDNSRAGLVDEPAETENVHHLYPVLVEDRDRVLAELQGEGVGVGIHYPVPCHVHPPYVRYASRPLPVVEDAAARLLSLPIYPHITPDQINRVVSALSHAVESGSPTTAAGS